MNKVHIALVGGQPVPVFIGLKDDGQANLIVLVCSNQSKEEANRICQQFPKRNIIIYECSPINLEDIEKLANNLFKEYIDYEKTINLTSGTKLWSLTFFHVFNKNEHTHFIYVDQTNTIIDILLKKSHQSMIETFKRFELYGTPLSSFRSLNEYTQEDYRVIKSIEYIRNKNRYEFFLLTDKKELHDNGVFTTERGSKIEYDTAAKWAKVTIKNDIGVLKKELQSEHIFDLLFNTGWFELKTAKELRQNQAIRNIWLNCKFTDVDGNPKNEIDIIAELGNRLLFVECKTMIHDTTDIDKFRSALRNFSGTSSTGIFVTNDKPNNNSRIRYEHAMEKCKDNDILTFNFGLRRNNPLSFPHINDLINNQILTQNKR